MASNIIFNPLKLEFGELEIGLQNTLSFSIKNESGEIITINSIEMPDQFTIPELKNIYPAHQDFEFTSIYHQDIRYEYYDDKLGDGNLYSEVYTGFGNIYNLKNTVICCKHKNIGSYYSKTDTTCCYDKKYTFDTKFDIPSNLFKIFIPVGTIEIKVNITGGIGALVIARYQRPPDLYYSDLETGLDVNNFTTNQYSLDQMASSDCKIKFESEMFTLVNDAPTINNDWLYIIIRDVKTSFAGVNVTQIIQHSWYMDWYYKFYNRSLDDGLRDPVANYSDETVSTWKHEEFTSIYSYGQKIQYLDRKVSKEIEYNNFKDLYNPKNSIVCCQKANDLCCDSLETFSFPFITVMCPVLHRIYVPPGTNDFVVVMNFSIPANLLIVSRYQKLPEISINSLTEDKLQGYIYQGMSKNDNKGYTLQQLKDDDCFNGVGADTGSQIIVKHVKMETEGGWIYFIIKPLVGGIRGLSFNTGVNMEIYRDWYKNMSGKWDKNGDPVASS